jgi:hypothetical protein
MQHQAVRELYPKKVQFGFFQPIYLVELAILLMILRKVYLILMNFIDGYLSRRALWKELPQRLSKMDNKNKNWFKRKFN